MLRTDSWRIGNDIELLVPAGGTEQFLAAVENGADAIYVGGQLFNARAGAQNFNDDELVLALDYAHKRGVKVYVTMSMYITVFWIMDYFLF